MKFTERKMTMNGIEVNNLNVDLKGFALKNINMSIPKGTVMGLIGRNGAGKSTLIKTISDGYKKESGEIRINGITCNEDRAAYFTMLSTVFDELNLNDMTKIKLLIKNAKKAYPIFDEEYFRERISFFRISEKQRLDKLSFGMKKKVQIIFALCLKPQVLILDEPTTGIDPSDREEILDMLMDFMQDENHTIMLSTHITSDLDKIADYITLIDNGEIVFSESKIDLQDKYRLIRCNEEQINESDREKLIGIKKNSFGIEALTKDKEIASKPGISSAIPTVEEIMVHFTEREEKHI